MGKAEPGLKVAADAVLHRKLVWLTLFRMVTITVLLGGTAVVGWDAGLYAVRVAQPLYALVVATYVASAAIAFALRRRRALVPIAFAQVALDVALAGVAVALTGAAESVFVFMYALAIVNGGILLFRRGAFTAAAVAAVVDASTILLLTPGPPRVVTVFVHVAALAAIATVMSYVSEQLRSADVRLAASELELEAMTALHEAIVQSVSSGLLTLDEAGRITFLNRAGAQILGVSAREVRGRSAEPWFGAHPASVARAETTVTHPSGEPRRLGYSAFALRGRGGGQPGGTAVIFQDLTELRAMEEAVARSERLADLGRVAAGLAHELRNPLAAMAGAVELLGAEAALDDEQRRLLRIVLRESSRLERLVSEFLGFARPRPMERRTVDLATLCGEALDVFAHDPAATAIRIERALRSATVECDPEQLRQVLWNLLVNAAQAIAELGAGGGVIEAGCGPAQDGGAWLAVRDDGPGISAADATRIFLPFFTTRREGTGLGLSTVHRIVDAHGGRIDVEPRTPRGTTFTVHLPPPAAASAVALRAAR
ncbi:MAG TPA: ATP-binding protein [Anaeromyxobacter sp.]|nr:ATP-binding protein [Anaeromyxobacter sp.]